MIPDYMIDEKVIFVPTDVFIVDRRSGVIIKAPNVANIDVNFSREINGLDSWQLTMYGHDTFKVCRDVNLNISEKEIQDIIMQGI